MRLSKTMLTLINRAERKGRAVKRVRQGAVMGNQSWGMSVQAYRDYVKSTPMIEQWAVTIEDTKQNGVEYRNVIVDHYGTQIAHIVVNKTQGTSELHDFYGESNSDRDTLNGLMDYYDLPHHFTYRPVNGGFEMHTTQTVTA